MIRILGKLAFPCLATVAPAAAAARADVAPAGGDPSPGGENLRSAGR